MLVCLEQRLVVFCFVYFTMLDDFPYVLIRRERCMSESGVFLGEVRSGEGQGEVGWKVTPQR